MWKNSCAASSSDCGVSDVKKYRQSNVCRLCLQLHFPVSRLSALRVSFWTKHLSTKVGPFCTGVFCFCSCTKGLLYALLIGIAYVCMFSKFLLLTRNLLSYLSLFWETKVLNLGRLQYFHFKILFCVSYLTNHSLFQGLKDTHSFLFFFFFFIATPTAYRSSQARAGTDGRCSWGHSHSHRNARSLAPWARPGMEAASSQALCQVLKSQSHSRNSPFVFMWEVLQFCFWHHEIPEHATRLTITTPILILYG